MVCPHTLLFSSGKLLPAVVFAQNNVTGLWLNCFGEPYLKHATSYTAFMATISQTSPTGNSDVSFHTSNICSDYMYSYWSEFYEIW